VTRKLTDKQSMALFIIKSAMSSNGTCPSIRELAKELGISAPTALNHLRALQKKGFVLREKGRARSMRLAVRRPQAETKPIKVPILGSISAGRPLLEEQQEGEFLNVDPRLLTDKAVFALKVSGDSMNGAGILDGDYVLARFQKLAQNGDIVVARLGAEMTVKRLSVRGRSRLLVAENPKYKSIPFEGDDAEIQGKVVAVVGRRL
jgi:repressor LexA